MMKSKIKFLLRTVLLIIIGIPSLYLFLFFGMWIFNIGKSVVQVKYYESFWHSAPIATDKRIQKIWSPDGNNVWVTGSDGLIAFGTKENLSVQESGTDLDLNGIWGCSLDDAWAVGGGKMIKHSLEHDDEAVMLHWNGKAWQRVSTPFDHVQSLQFVWGSSCNDIWAGGRIISKAALLHWDGKVWSEVSLPSSLQGFTLAGLGGFTASEVYVATGKLLARWDLQKWQTVNDTYRFDDDLDGLLVLPSHSLLAWSNHPLDHYSAVEIYDDKTGWSRVTCRFPVANQITAIVAENPDDAWVLTDSLLGRIYHITNHECVLDGATKSNLDSLNNVFGKIFKSKLLFPRSAGLVDGHLCLGGDQGQFACREK